MEDRAQLLIDILFDPTAREDERDDAVMDLVDYPEQRVVNALTKIVSNPQEDCILDTASESLAAIYLELGMFDSEAFTKMVPCAQRIVFDLVISSSPELISETIRKEYFGKFRSSKFLSKVPRKKH